MQINTTRFGTQAIDPDTILSFPQGIPGFEGCTEFKLFHEQDANPVVYFLQAVSDPDVTFSVVDPTVLGFHYELPLGAEEAALLQMDRIDDIAVLLMLSERDQKQPMRQTTGTKIRPNITSPILVNTRTRIGFQKPLRDLQYQVTFKVPDRDALA